MLPASDNSAKTGHNEGPPLDPGRSWRRHCWKRAHKELWKSPTIEIVRRRMARAERLGLSYKRYATILLGGSDIEGILFAGESIIFRAAEAARHDHIWNKLATISSCQRLLLARRNQICVFAQANPERYAIFDALVGVSSPEPKAHPLPKPDRDVLRAALQKQALAARTVALVGNSSSVQSGSQQRGLQASLLQPSISPNDGSGVARQERGRTGQRCQLCKGRVAC